MGDHQGRFARQRVRAGVASAAGKEQPEGEGGEEQFDFHAQTIGSSRDVHVSAHSQSASRLFHQAGVHLGGPTLHGAPMPNLPSILRALIVPVLAVSCLFAPVWADERDVDKSNEPYAVGLWGDLPYSPAQATVGVPNLIADMNAQRPKVLATTCVIRRRMRPSTRRAILPICAGCRRVSSKRKSEHRSPSC